jgi:hypothetical protein
MNEANDFKKAQKTNDHMTMQAANQELDEATKDFAKLMNMVVKGDPRAKQVVERMVQEIEQSLKNEDWEEDEYNREMDNYDDDDNDGGGDDLDDFLGSLGITTSKD